MNQTTLFDLHQTASAAALTAQDKTSLQVESIRLESFTAAGHDPADFDQWSEYYNSIRTNYHALKQTPSPAARAATVAAPAPAPTQTNP